MKKSKIEAILNLIDELDDEGGSANSPRNTNKTDPEELRRLYREYVQHTDFKPGMIVTWKSDAMIYKNLGKNNKLMIVASVLEQPVYDRSNDAGSTYFNDALDIVLGILDRDEELIFVHMNSKRLKQVDHVNTAGGEL